MCLYPSTDAPYNDLDNKTGKFVDAVGTRRNGDVKAGNAGEADSSSKHSFPLVLSWLATKELAGQDDENFFKSTTTTNNNNISSPVSTTRGPRRDSSLSSSSVVTAVAPLLPTPAPLKSTRQQGGDTNKRYAQVSSQDRSSNHVGSLHFEELAPTSVGGVKSRDQIRRDLSRLTARLRSNNNAAAVVTDADNANANSKYFFRVP